MNEVWSIIEIDLNDRIDDEGLTYAGFEQIAFGPSNTMWTGEEVYVSVEEFGIVGTGLVEKIDIEHEIVYLRVDFSALVFECGEGEA